METLLQSILATANMKNYQPDNLKPGMKGGVFFGLTQHTVFPVPQVGEVECTQLDEKVFGVKGEIYEIKPLGIGREVFDATATLTGDTSAKVHEKLRNITANVATIPQNDRITYLYNDGKTEATVVQTFRGQTLFGGAFTEFWVTHNVSGYPNFNIRMWWERT